MGWKMGIRLSPDCRACADRPPLPRVPRVLPCVPNGRHPRREISLILMAHHQEDQHALLAKGHERIEAGRGDPDRRGAWLEGTRGDGHILEPPIAAIMEQERFGPDALDDVRGSVNRCLLSA